MNIKNPETLSKELIVGINGQMWIVNECNKLADAERNLPAYEFECITDVPVKSSPNQQYYHMTKTLRARAELTLYDKSFELLCNGEIKYGPIVAIDTKDKFISVLTEMLPANF